MTLLVSFVVMGVTAWLFVRIPKGFFPTEDTGFLSASTEAAEDTSFEQMLKYQQQVTDIIAKNPYIAAYQSSAGGGPSGGAVNTGRVFIRLSDRKHRPGAERSCSNCVSSSRCERCKHLHPDTAVHPDRWQQQ